MDTWSLPWNATYVITISSPSLKNEMYKGPRPFHLKLPRKGKREHLAVEEGNLHVLFEFTLILISYHSSAIFAWSSSEV